jgi:hypothetical protein
MGGPMSRSRRRRLAVQNAHARALTGMSAVLDPAPMGEISGYDDVTTDDDAASDGTASDGTASDDAVSEAEWLERLAAAAHAQVRAAAWRDKIIVGAMAARPNGEMIPRTRIASAVGLSVSRVHRIYDEGAAGAEAAGADGLSTSA